MAQLERKQGAGEARWSDGWDGYPAARRRPLSQIAEQNITNLVVIGGDIHSFWVTDLKPDFNDPVSPTVATEFVGTSVPRRVCLMTSSAGSCRGTHTPGSSRAASVATTSPRRRAASGALSLRIVNTITKPEATARALKAYAVEAGKAGAQEA